MIPAVMAEWITTVVAPDSGVAASTLESKGLWFLKVRDLKRIRSSIYATGCVSISQRVPSGANKKKLVDAIHALLKMDNHLLVARVRADLQPRGQQQNTRHAARVPVESQSACISSKPHHPSLPHTTSTMHQGTTRNRSTPSIGRKRPAHHMSNNVSHKPPDMPYAGVPYAGYRVPAPAVSGFSMPQLGSSHYQNYLRVQNPLFTAASHPQNPNLSVPSGSMGQKNLRAGVNGMHTGAAAVSHRNLHDNALANSNPDYVATNSPGEGNIPKTPQEVSFFSQLLGMGFQDREEVMRGIRQSNATSADEVMMWIIQEREEREEARKMDEARLRSEQLRKENAEKQMRAFQERLNAATSRDDFRKIYGQSSWVLDDLDDAHFRRLVSHQKNCLVRLLKLESNARKWYQDKLPTCYFRDLCRRGNLCNHTEFDSWLMKECDALESGLYKLELQQGGVPKLFIRAQESHPDYKENDESDDEIVFCGTRQPEEGISRSSS